MKKSDLTLDIKNELIRIANQEYGKIVPVRKSHKLEDDHSFTIVDCKGQIKGAVVFFWFNTPDDSTHLVKKEY
jgi:hypothetical protein